MKESTIAKHKKLINTETDLFIIKDIITKISNNKERIYYLCECKNCHKLNEIRNDSIKNRFACKYCIGNWRKENFNKLYKDLSPKDIRHKYIHFKCNAKVRNISFDLTKEEVQNICEQSCFYCGKLRCLGIDRLDNSKGYTIDNCVPCCGCCNKMKMDLTPTFFFEQIKKIYDLHKESSTTIPKGSTSKVKVDGNGEHLNYLR